MVEQCCFHDMIPASKVGGWLALVYFHNEGNTRSHHTGFSRKKWKNRLGIPATISPSSIVSCRFAKGLVRFTPPLGSSGHISASLR